MTIQCLYIQYNGLFYTSNTDYYFFLNSVASASEVRLVLLRISYSVNIFINNLKMDLLRIIPLITEAVKST